MSAAPIQFWRDVLAARKNNLALAWEEWRQQKADLQRVAREVKAMDARLKSMGRQGITHCSSEDVNPE